MFGIVYHINSVRGMISAQIEDGSFAVLEVGNTSGFTSGDEIVGDFDVLGEGTFLNEETNETFSAIVQNIGCLESHAKSRVFL